MLCALRLEEVGGSSSTVTPGGGGGAASGSSEYLTDDLRVNLHILQRVDRSQCWRDLFLFCQKRQSHFLAEILVIINHGRI